MHIDLLTLFPEMVEPMFNHSILKRAYEKETFTYDIVNFRDYSLDKHKKIDDYPYGGGAGMVLTPQPIFDCVEEMKKRQMEKKNSRIILLCPQGERYNQQKAEQLAKEDHLIFICGHYEGYDERIRKHLVTDEISIGDFILTGGEIGALAIIDSVVRLLPNALGNEASIEEESFSNHLLEYPHYTRPSDFRGMKVPEVLLSGHHEKINEWRRNQSLIRTYDRRKDLLERAELTEEDITFLKQLKQKNEK